MPPLTEGGLAAHNRRLRLGAVLVEAGYVTAQDLERALGEQRRRPGRKLGEVLVAQGALTETQLAQVLADRFQLAFVDLEAHGVDAALASLVPTPLLVRHRMLPFAEDDKHVLYVAVADPFAVHGLDAVRLSTRRAVQPVLTTASALERKLEEHAGHAVGATGVSSKNDVEEIFRELERAAPREALREGHGAEAPIVDETDSGIIRLVNQMLTDAYRRGASDVHVEPNGALRPAVVRLRVDGECVPYHDVPPAFVRPIVARLKIMAELDISERRKPQDGKIHFRVGDVPIELRVATVPTAGGNEDVVLRILPPQRPRPLAEMGCSARDRAELERLVRLPYGLFLCVGPTGSGKTTTLHSCLAAINTPDVKIWTVEDPVEITQPGLRQVHINRKIGLDFASAMRSFLRADPDIIMVGEMRDLETASMAIEASLTGHLVLSTLHTNNAPETVVRLLDMGLDPFAFGDSLVGVLAQRLVRTLCPACSEPYEAGPEDVATIEAAFGSVRALAVELGRDPDEPFVLERARGCPSCGHAGYRGRQALFELLVVSDEMRAAIAHRVGMDRLRELAAATGMRTLLQDGVLKAAQGSTDLRQVLAVCAR
jgi:type II secretory ATPase GspE/PulE/Tfp pilus assembly ATPase PilB-like protein